MSFFLLLGKEFRELVSSYKLVFVPLVFALLGVAQPATFKLMPRLLSTASNLPEGTVIQIPTPTNGEIMASVLGQFSQVGVLLLVLVAMGTVAGERQSGVAATVLTKPVRRGAYLAAKATAFSLLAAFSLAVGVALGGYYSEVLFGPVDWHAVWLGALLYLPNLLLAVNITVALSALLPSPVAAGGTALATYILLSLLPPYLGRLPRQAGPSALGEQAVAVMKGLALHGAEVGGVAFPGASLPVVAVLLAALLFAVAGWIGFRRSEI